MIVEAARIGLRAVLAATVIAAVGAPSLAAAAQVGFAELAQRPKPKPTARIPYGPAAAQFVELWLPAGSGPHPVVIMLHGGCWLEKVADLSLMNHIAEDLRRHGIAVWNVEYRRIGEPGGGYPGTFEDVGQAVDLLRTSAAKYGLKLDQVVAVGHSAGGHLAQWAAGRARLPANSALYVPHPLKIDSVVGLGSLADLEAVSALNNTCGGAETIRALTGPVTGTHPDVFADTAPAALEPIAAREIMIHGAADSIAPPVYGTSYRDKAARRGAKVEVSLIPDAGHFDLIAPETPAWTQVRTTISGLLRLGRFGGQAAPAPKPAAKPW